MSWLCNLDLQNAKEVKHHSSSSLPRTCTKAILANLKYPGNEQVNTLDVEKMC
jgi:hypothetical protein